MLLSLASIALAQHAPPVVNGHTTSDYPAVGALMVCYSGTNCSAFCSGTLVDPNWVVTAAHCIDPLQQYAWQGQTVAFGVGPATNRLDDRADMVSWHVYPGYSDYTLAHDIAVVELGGGGIRSVDPVHVNPDPINGGWTGRELQYVGYGVTGDYNNDSGTKRTAAMPVHSYDSGFVYSRDTADQQNICFGDSGGAALERVEDGQWELAGVNSHVFGVLYNNRTCEGGGSGATRVDAYLDWIRGYVDVGGYEPPEEEPEQEPQDEEPQDDPQDNPEDPEQPGGDWSAWGTPIVVPQGGHARSRIVVEGLQDYELFLGQPLHGETQLAADGDWVEFTADPDYAGLDDFTVVVIDGDDTVQVHVEVEIMARAGGCSSAPGGAGWAAALGGLALAVGRRRARRTG
jgi:MYXO-CTERM domain-containing protein